MKIKIVPVNSLCILKIIRSHSSKHCFTTDKMAQLSKSKTRARYSIGEWYGRDITRITEAVRRKSASNEIVLDALTGTTCPFQRNRNCNKKGGVCSLRLYEQTGKGIVHGVGSPIATCPSRFLEDGMIFRWVSETLLGTSEPIVLSEIGFLDRLQNPAANQLDEEDVSSEVIGRIDNVLLHPSKTPLEWCALEIQAVYFSGKAMKQEFSMLSKHVGDFPFPAAHRRPDWRSSGPKRLLPQLQTKTPTIRTWGKKMAVVIDEPFFGSLVGLEEEKYLSNAEIVWFVVSYKETKHGWKMVPGKAVFTKLESSVKALTGGIPLPKEQFEAQLIGKLKAIQPNSPLISAV